MGKERSMRHYKRPLTVVRANLDYKLNNHHNFNLNYHLSRTGNDRYDDLDTTFEPSNDVVSKHILGLSYNQSLLEGKMENVFFIKNYINHPNIRQTDQPSVTGSEAVQGSTTKNDPQVRRRTSVHCDGSFSREVSYEQAEIAPSHVKWIANVCIFTPT